MAPTGSLHPARASRAALFPPGARQCVGRVRCVPALESARLPAAHSRGTAMDRTFGTLGALSAFIGVAAGAFGAHSLRQHLRADLQVTFETAARYQLYHALALLLVALAAARGGGATLQFAGWMFAVGTVVFCGSLYLLALTGARWLGAVTPLGGLAFLLGWLALAWYASRLVCCPRRICAAASARASSAAPPASSPSTSGTCTSERAAPSTACTARTTRCSTSTSSPASSTCRSSPACARCDKSGSHLFQKLLERPDGHEVAVETLAAARESVSQVAPRFAVASKTRSQLHVAVDRGGDGVGSLKQAQNGLGVAAAHQLPRQRHDREAGGECLQRGVAARPA